MANKFNGFLNNVGQGLLGPKGNLGDFQHASRLYVGNAFRLAPKVKFLYHVHFELGPTVKSNLKKFNTELDMLVKTADLPKFQVATVEQRNQYNRKRNLVQKIEYSPVNITFHDDNLHLTTQLWKQYYAYMFADHNTARITGAYNRTAYLDQPLGVSYGMDNNASAPFFTSITLYQLSRQTFQSFKLISVFGGMFPLIDMLLTYYSFIYVCKIVFSSFNKSVLLILVQLIPSIVLIVKIANALLLHLLLECCSSC